MTEMIHPAPSIELGSEPYWKAANEGRLLVKVCEDCGKAHFYPRPICPFCHSEKTVWKPAKGTGNVYSYSVMRRSNPSYVIAYVRLAEGCTMLTHIVDADPDNISIDMPVEVAFRDATDGQSLPVFRPSAGDQAEVE